MRKITSLLASIPLMFMISSVSADTLQDVTVDISDAAITTEIKGSLLKIQLVNDADYNTWDVHIETLHGVVLLTGHVKNEEDKNKVIDVAKAISGVKGVFDQITIE